MKNYEFYEKELREHGCVFSLIDGEFDKCCLMNCYKCYFDTKVFYKENLCWNRRFEFLNKEHEENDTVITEDEKELCKLLGNGYLARNKDNYLYWYNIKPPYKEENTWYFMEHSKRLNITNIFPSCKFNFVKWEDNIPWGILEHYSIVFGENDNCRI